MAPGPKKSGENSLPRFRLIHPEIQKKDLDGENSPLFFYLDAFPQPKIIKKISLPEPQPEKITKIRKLSDSFVQNKMKPKILFAPSTHIAERKKKKDKREEKPAVMLRNFTSRGKKVVNLGDTETFESLSSEPADCELTVPRVEWFVQSQVSYS